MSLANSLLNIIINGTHEEILSYFQDFTTAEYDRKRAVVTAVVNGRLDVVKLLVENDFPLWYERPGECLLIQALRLMRRQPPGITQVIDMIHYLCEKGVNIEGRNEYQETALLIASSKGYLEIVKVFIQLGADIDMQDKWGHTPLLQAAGKGHTEVVETLLKARANKTIADKWGMTPVDNTRKFKRDDCLALLLANDENSP